MNYSQQRPGYLTLRLRSGNGIGNRSLSGVEGALQLGKEILLLRIVDIHKKKNKGSQLFSAKGGRKVPSTW